jgi:hypothetical protein
MYGFDQKGRYDGTEKYYWAFEEFLMVLEKLRTSPIQGNSILPNRFRQIFTCGG